MDLYLSNCRKAAEGVATKVASSSLTTDIEQCSIVSVSSPSSSSWHLGGVLGGLADERGGDLCRAGQEWEEGVGH